MQNKDIRERVTDIINEVEREQRLVNQRLQYGKTFNRFDKANDIVENYKTIVTSPLWSNSSTVLDTFYSGSNNTPSSSEYFYSVYQTASSDSNAVVQFDIGWGHRLGSGSYSGGGDTNDSPSKAVYSQWKQKLLEPNDDTFTFGSENSDNIYVIAVKRARFKERIDPGNFEIHLSELNGDSYSNTNYTGSNVEVSSSGAKIKLIDDSQNSDSSITLQGGGSRVYNIRSGSINDGIYSGDSTIYGLFYPEEGAFILNGNVLNVSASFNTVTSSNVYGDNIKKLFLSMSGSANFEGRSSETINSTYYYCRLQNKDFNYSTNPTFTTGSAGDLKYASFIKNPQVYFTSIGLYNDNYELLAVAKLSEPIKKNFNTERIIKCKLDW